MCTVTFIPQEKNGFILSSNRDVNAERSPQSISQIRQNGKTLTFPRDVTAGGTWIAFSDSDQMVCLLNGAFENHKHNPPYRRSRGLMVLDYFDFPTTEDFIAQYDFEGIEPFTFIIYDNGNLHELRWDEQQLHHTPLSTSGYYIWSSSTLYSRKFAKNDSNGLIIGSTSATVSTSRPYKASICVVENRIHGMDLL
jgi:uncharacterized protein with NRDE domain